MNRNVESHFAELPSVDIERSIFDRSSVHKTSFNVGELIPFYVDEVLPGDTFNVTTSKVVRLQTLLNPIYDSIFLDTYFFFVPNRLTWTHWKEFAGENTGSAWIPQTSYQIPSISSPASTGFATGTIADYMGLPVGVVWTNSASKRPSALPFRAYALICNEFFRDENLTDPLNIPLGDSNQTGTNGNSYINDVANGGKPFLAAKYHDYFSSCLPSTQKGPTVTFPLINGGLAPVYATASQIPQPLSHSGMMLTNTETNTQRFAGLVDYVNNSVRYAKLDPFGSDYATVSGSMTDANWRPDNLWADLSSSVGAVSINELRLSFQLQRYYERLARSGSRYIEFLEGFFGIHAFEGVLQRPEYLGGNRIPLNIHEVINTSQSTNDYLGDLGAMSVTADRHEDFVHSFTEHGYVIGVCVARYDHSYAQGLERFWTRRNFTDFYLPTFSNLGEMPVYKCELYADATTMTDDSVWGYQECWADYRYKPDRISGELRPGITNTLASWHFSDYYTQAPTLSDSWIREDKTNVDRTLAVTSTTSNQIFADILIKNIATRPMPMYSIPGLIDHH